ncbi:MAG: hypothetical protein KKA61_02230, partial [Nanoarchaeota archaeon]|nr:hypothetical protein [Nanoarchaeota archaeon]
MKSEINEKQVNILIERKKSLIVSKTVMGIILIPLILLSLFIWVFIWTVLLYFLFIPLIIILFLKLSSINKELTDINFKLAGASEKIRTKGFEIERKQKEFDSNIKNYFHKPEH